MKAERLTAAGAPGKAPLPRWSSLTLSTVRVRNNRVAMHNSVGTNSVDFQTCRLADPPDSAGREAALEVGLEICAVVVRARAYNFSLSFVNSCHR